MDKIINPISYKKMAESYAKPAYKLREGVGAGYQLTFIDIKLTNVKVGKTEKDGDGFDVAKFTADIIPGEYGWYADHPYWTAASSGNPEPYNFDSSMNPFSSKAVITGGKVEGTCDDGGTAWRTEGSPWSEKQFIDEIESEDFIIQDSYSGGWVLSPMTDTLEWENEVRPGYEKYIDDTPSERGNLAVIEKISFEFDPEWVMDYNEAIDYAKDPDEYEEDEWDDEEDEDFEESKIRESEGDIVWYVDYIVGNTHKTKKVRAKTAKEAIKRARVKDIEDIMTEDEVLKAQAKAEANRKANEEADKKAFLRQMGIIESKKSGKSKLNESEDDDFSNVLEFVDTYCAEYGHDFSEASKRNLAERVLDYMYDHDFDINDEDYLDMVIRKYLENPEDFEESKKSKGKKLNEYTVKDWFDENGYVQARDKADPFDRYYAIQITKVNPDYRKYFHHTANVGDLWAGSSFTFVDEIGDAELYATKKEAEEALKEVNDIMDRLAKYKRFDGKPYEFEIVGGEKNVYLDESKIKENWEKECSDYYDAHHDDKWYNLSDDEKAEYYNNWLEGTLNESKLKEDALSSQVRQSVLDVQAAKKQVDADVAVLDKKVDKVSNDIIRIATNRPMQESGVSHIIKYITVDFPINHTTEDEESNAKKLIRYISAERKLRINTEYKVTDSNGMRTDWKFQKLEDHPVYQYRFFCCDASDCPSLFINKKNNKIDLKNAKFEYDPNCATCDEDDEEASEKEYWDEVSDTQRYFGFDENRKSRKERLIEANRYTHRLVLKSDDYNTPMSYKLNNADRFRYKSEEEAKEALERLDQSHGARLHSKGLHLEIEEIPQKPRKVASQAPDFENPFEVGDVLCGSWGYNTVIPEWYEVSKVTSKQITVKPLSTIVVSHDGYGQAGIKRPNLGVYKKDWQGNVPEIRVAVKKHNPRYVTSSDPKAAYYVVIHDTIFDIWDGKAKDFDTYD